MSEPALQQEKSDPAFAAAAMPSVALPALQSAEAVLPRPPVRLTPRQLPVSVSFLSSRVARMIAANLQAEGGHGEIFLWLPVAAGLGAAACFSLRFDPSITVLALAFAGLSAVALRAHIRSGRHLALALLLASFCAGALAAALQAGRSPVLLDSDVTTEITGRVEMRDIDADGRVRYLIALEATAAPTIRRPPERVRVVARADQPALPIGARIKGRARLSAPSGPALPGGYDFAFSALQSGIGAYGFFFGAPVELSPAPERAGPVARSLEYVRMLRDRISGRIRSVVPGDAGAIAATLAVSDRRGISVEVVDQLRATGLAHILAISGLHMALAAGTLYVGLRRLMALFPAIVEAWPVKKIAASGALLAATAYLLLSGASVPTQRAWIMLMTMLLAVLIDRPALTMRNVALAALIIIVLSPAAVVSPGFQMSFAATAALIAAYGGWASRAAHSHEAQRAPPGRGLLRVAVGFIGGLLMTSLVAGLATGLFAAHHFYRIAAWGMLANLLAMPLMTLVVMPAGLVALMLMPFGLDVWPLRLMGRGLDGIIAAAAWVDSLGGDVVVGQVPLLSTALAASGFIVLVLLRSRLRFAGLAPIALGAMLMLPQLRPEPPDIAISEDGRLVALRHGQTLASNAERPSAFVFEQWQRALRAENHDPPVMLRQPPKDGEADAAAVSTPSGPDGPASAADEAELKRQQRMDAERMLADLLHHATADPGRFVCRDRSHCVAIARGAVIAAVSDGASIGPACDIADLVVVGFPVRIDACRSGAMLVTARTLRRSGAMAIRIEVDDSAATGKAGMAAAASQGASPKHSHMSGERSNIGFSVTQALGGVIRPWTIQRYYDWRSGKYQTAETANFSDRQNETGPLGGGPENDL